MEDNEAALMVMAADGSDARVLLSHRWDFSRGGFNMNHPAWSPDETRIAFVKTPMASPDPEWGIHVINVDGTGQTQVTYGGVRPAWSPDGTKIAYGWEEDIHFVDVDGSNDTRITTGRQPTWSPEGGRLAFIYNQDLYVRDLATGVETNITTGTPLDGMEVLGGPDWANTQDKIAVAAGTQTHQCAHDPRSYSCYVRDIWIIDLEDPMHPVNLTNTPQDDGFPHAETSATWSSDDSQIFFTRNGDVFVIGADGSGETLVRAHNPTGKWTHEQLRFPDHKR
jgi:Tol biopolymer transport system component